MRANAAMSATLPRKGSATDRQYESRPLAEGSESERKQARLKRYWERLSGFYSGALRVGVAAVGGEWGVCERIGREAGSYNTQISKALNRADESGERKFAVDWLVALLDDTQAAYPIVDGIVEIAAEALTADPERFGGWLLRLAQLAGGSLVGTDALHQLVTYLCDAGGYDPPKRSRPMNADEEGAAALEVIGEMPPEMQAFFRQSIAKKRGVRPGSVQLGLRGVK